MLASLLALAAASTAPAPQDVEGRCFYPEAFESVRETALLALCDRAEVRPDKVVFSRNGENQMRFSGVWEDGLFQVDEVVLRTGRRVEVKGSCRVDTRYDTTSAVSCLAHRRGFAYAANLIVPNI
ncbi:hypothetical protein [Paraurantiacibacter namhicola]|uniref:Uncharacterized protein n=1 Tax=Paraurantiacibacter namhicola TaxID=645517 RepID=A0A1C7D6V4_9SPHN|nr:hypothetical protein [Paraurantiacibacter namhicola]ANU07216.1 hypothetical protein A6F65_00905 [Paraurantiacibacter namhicola]